MVANSRGELCVVRGPGIYGDTMEIKWRGNPLPSSRGRSTEGKTNCRTGQMKVPVPHDPDLTRREEERSSTEYSKLVGSGMNRTDKDECGRVDLVD